MKPSIQNRSAKSEQIRCLDDQLSEREIALDSSGYFLIRVDSVNDAIVVEHFTNDLDEVGRAIDPETGEILDCHGVGLRVPVKVYRARSAKELGIQLTEGSPPYPLSKLDHALYLGRELQRAETCMIKGIPYVQD